MSRKADFNAEEWSNVVAGPAYAGLYVSGASRGGTLREGLAMGRVYQEARKQHGTSELLDELVTSPPALDQARSAASAAEGREVGDVVRERLREAMEILETKASPEEIDAYKKFVMSVAQAAAAAHKEGGFLGIGGKQVSEEEDKALDEISMALGPPPSS